MKPAIIRTGALTPVQREAVEELVAVVAAADQVAPLNEAARFALDGHGHVVHWLAWLGDRLAGYAQCDRDSHSVQLLVDPELRRRGVGGALAEAIGQVEKQPHWWAFDNLPGAQALASRIGARLERELLIMERDLVAHPLGELGETPAGVEIRSYQPSDALALVEVNAEAFSDHPEQGEMTEEEFALRCAEPWFDPEGLLVARDEETGAMLGFHWTKVDQADPNHPTEAVGEVYVIAVSPEASGRGIGRALLGAGLHHLADRGVRRVRLYVEASATRVVRMYESASFVPVTKDASYSG